MRGRAAVLPARFDLGRLLNALLPRRERRVEVRRPDDLLVFDLVTVNLRLQPGAEPKLEKRDPAAAAYLIVELPPQSFAEEAYLEVANESAGEIAPDPNDPLIEKKRIPAEKEKVRPLPSSRVRMAGPSRLAFVMPPGQTSLSYTFAAVLEAMRTWPPSLSVNALPDLEPSLRHPGLVGGYRDWLGTAVAAPAWRATVGGLTTALERSGARGVEREIAASAQRVAERAAGGLKGSARRSLGRVMFEAVDGEMSELVRRFPALREGASHQAALAALSLAAAESLAPAAARAGFDVGLAGELAFFPLLLGPHEPSPHVTALELPYRLILSPVEQARWLHHDAPVERRGRTELWHTRLTTAARGEDAGPDLPAKVRALWSPDYPEELDLIPLLVKPFRGSLDPLDRRMLVHLMAGYGDKGFPGGPRASQAKRLHLSALGGLLEVEGNWDHRPTAVDLQEWRHVATLGRDNYVRVVYAGYLCPFGHAASLVKVTERKFESLEGDPKRRVAVLRQRYYLRVRERVKEYSGQGHVFAGHNLPLRRVEIPRNETPNLKEPGVGDSALQPFPGDKILGEVDGPDRKKATIAERMAFWPMVSSAGAAVDFRFEILATDIAGHRICFSLPLLFVGEVANFAKSAEIQRAYNNTPPVPRRQAEFGGACVCYAPYEPEAKGDTRLPTEWMAFAAGKMIGKARKDIPSFYPETAAARAGIPALQKMLGREAVVGVTYPETYKRHGFGGDNHGELFLQLIGKAYAYSRRPDEDTGEEIKVDLGFKGMAYPLEFGPEKAKSDALGALATPQMSILALSRIMGPVAGEAPAEPAEPPAVAAALEDAKQNRSNPAKFFPPDLPTSAKILGGVDLAKILKPVEPVDGGLASDAVPKLLSRELPATAAFPACTEARFEWTTEVKQLAQELLIPCADRDPRHPTMLVMRSFVKTPLADPSKATYDTYAELNNFKINLFGCVILWFERLRFSAKQGRKPDVIVELHRKTGPQDDPVQFGGPLEFVNTLRKVIPADGFSDPPSLAVTPSGISASYSLTLPTIGVGIFALANVSLGAGFDLPFDARPASVRFNFCERQHPFSLTVAFLGGGGFFAIAVSARGVQEIEAALEFGAALIIDLGVASGGVEIKAGVYYHWLQASPSAVGGSVELVGYVRIHGELSVLAIISVSLTFELKLGYLKLKDEKKSLVWGEASLIVEIEILFFSFDVTVRVRREFAGAESDPKFIDLVPDAATWTEYCEAFAEEEAA